jgi:hypothetical protein
VTRSHATTASIALLRCTAGAIVALLPAIATAEQSSSLQPTMRRFAALSPQQQQILDEARDELQRAALPAAEQQVRLYAVAAAMAGTVAVPDDDNPEVRNPACWTPTPDGYVVAPQITAAEAITDLWVVHEGDGVPIPRIWCYKYSSLILARAYVAYFQETGNRAGLETINELAGHRIFPGELPNGGEALLWRRRRGKGNLLPGDQVWFDNPFFDRGYALLRTQAYEQAVRDGKPTAEAATLAEAAARSAAAGEEGSNVFWLGGNRVTRGACSVVRAFRSGASGRQSAIGAGYDQVPTKKLFTLPRYQQHIIDDFNTVQAMLAARPNEVHPHDFQIVRVRSLVNPQDIVDPQGLVQRTLQADRLINALASRNKEPRLVHLGDARLPLFAAEYDWAEQTRVRAALLAVLHCKSDLMWWRLREHANDHRYILTATFQNKAENFSVAAFCDDFAAADLSLAYRRHLPAVVGQLPPGFRPEKVFLDHEAEWAHTRKPLAEMQIEVCRQTLRQWDAVAGTVPGKDGRSHTYTAEEKTHFRQAVAAEITDLTRRRQAVFLDAVLPGVAAPSGWEGFDADSAQCAHHEYQAARSKTLAE